MLLFSRAKETLHFGVAFVLGGSMKKKDHQQDFTLAHKRYERGYRYCQEIGFYSTVTENENYINGEQWGNVESNGLPTPVFNLEKRIMD